MSQIAHDHQYILELIADWFPKDELRPGLTTSYVDNGKTYASVVRWPRGNIKLIVASCKRPSLGSALAELKRQLILFMDQGRHLIPYVESPQTAHPPQNVEVSPRAVIATQK